MSQVKLEKTMDEYFVKKAPFQIPENGRKAITEWVPWIALVFGIIALFAAVGLWQAGHTVNVLVDYANSISRSYGGEIVNTLGATYYLALGALVVQGLLMLAAFPGLKAKSKKKGWDILLFATVINFIYGVFVVFTDYGSISNLFGSAIGVILGLYILAQIKSYYK